MKRFLLAALVSTNAYAIDPVTVVMLQVATPAVMYESWNESPVEKDPVVVRSVGVGKTCERALENAKTSAIDTAVGVWMSSEKNVYNSDYNEKIVEYSGGIIKSYKVLNNTCNTVEIEAEVIPRSNKVKTTSADISTEMKDTLKAKLENEKKRQIAIAEVNNRSKAIGFDIKDIEFIGNKVIITGDMFFQKKWVNDYLDLKKQAGGFILDNFHKPIKLNIIGTSNGKEVYSSIYQLNYDGIELYRVENDDSVTIFPKKRDTIRLTFMMDSGIIMNVDKLTVRVL